MRFGRGRFIGCIRFRGLWRLHKLLLGVAGSFWEVGVLEEGDTRDGGRDVSWCCMYEAYTWHCCI